MRNRLVERPQYLIVLLSSLLSSLGSVGCAALGLGDERAERAPASHLSETEQEAAEAESERLQQAMERQDLTLGMSPSDVKRIWGEPYDVETAGEARLGNQRWTYYNGINSRYGLYPKRIVYFESHRVAGWDTTR
jgi:hypothetical protein